MKQGIKTALTAIATVAIAAVAAAATSASTATAADTFAGVRLQTLETSSAGKRKTTCYVARSASVQSALP